MFSDRAHRSKNTDSNRLSINRMLKIVTIFKKLTLKFTIFDFNTDKSRVATGGYCFQTPDFFCATVTLPG